MNQRELEDLQVNLGEQRFQRRLLKAAEGGDTTRVGAGRKLLAEGVSRLEEVISIWCRTPRRGARHTAMKWITLVGPDVAAFFTARQVLQVLAGARKTADVARLVTADILTHLKAKRFQERAPHLYEYRLASFTTSNAAHMARSLSGTMRHAVCLECYKAGVRPEGEDRRGCEHLRTDDLDLSQDERIRVGLKLIDLFLEALPGVVEASVEKAAWHSGSTHLRMTRRKRVAALKEQVHILRLSDEAKSWAEERNAILAELDPALLPMVEPPLQWGPEQPGGYRYALRGHIPMVRAHRQPAGLGEHTYAALNRIQETPWRINLGVLEVLEELVRRGGGRAGLPHLEPQPQPTRPAILDTPEEEGYAEALRAYKDAKHEWHQQENVRLSKSKALLSSLSVAQRFAGAPAIWFPWNVDFRGRAYAIPTGLQPQGNDLAKGLLTFAGGTHIGTHGRRWLALHGSTCIGEWKGQKIGRLTLDERVALIERLTPDIYAVERDPFTETWWMETEYPFKTLAFCFEWAGADRGGPSYFSSLPVAVDGTCNGLQHFSALLQDETGARAVNVMPSDTPNDVYQDVTDRVLERLQADASNHWARLWLASGEVDRKLCKRPTMTFGYGSVRFGFVRQLEEELRGRGVNLKDLLVDEDGRTTPEQGLGYLADALLATLGDVIPGAVRARDWMQALARQIAKAGGMVRWWAPGTGFPVTQDGFGYRATELRQIDTFLGGVRYQPAIYEPTKDPRVDKQANAVAPNFIHSIDAAAMMLTVLRSSEEGLVHFSMVHDSFATLAGHMDVLARATRQAFAHIYTSTDVLTDFYNQLIDQALDLGVPAADIPDPPEPGDLDVNQVLASEYFFA